VSLEDRRREFAEHIVRCADTVSLLRPGEVEDIYQRAAAGEFDADLDWRLPHLEVPCTG
jgi:hypothetical protein